MLGRLYSLQPQTWQPVEARGEINNPVFGLGASILLRGHADITKENWLEDLPVHPRPELVGGAEKPYDKPWKSMSRLLAQAREAVMRQHAQMLQTGELRRVVLNGKMGRAMISRLDPGSTIFWHVDDGPYHQKHSRFHLPLITNPGCKMYSGHEELHVEAGILFFFNNKIRHSAANWGKYQRLHLIFEMRHAEETEGDEP